MREILGVIVLLLLTRDVYPQSWEVNIVEDNIPVGWVRVANINKVNLMDPENGDNYPDLVVQSGNDLFWYKNERPGWTLHAIDSTLTHSEDLWMDIIDVNDDGDEDIFYVYDMEFNWIENIDGGSEWMRQVIEFNAFGSALTFTGRAGWIGNSHSDFDGDGDEDVLINLTGFYMFEAIRHYWFEYDGSDTGNDPWEFHDIGGGWDGWNGENYESAWSTVENIDNDGQQDVLVYPSNISPDQGIAWCEKIPDGDNSWDCQLITTGGGISTGSHVLDADMDNDNDIVVVNKSLQTIEYYANPDWNVMIIANDMPNVIIGPPIDLDGDGDDDITFGSSSAAGTLGWLENPGGGPWTKHIIDDTSSYAQIVAGVADIDGDDRIDVVVMPYARDNMAEVRWYANRMTTAIDQVEDDHFDPRLLDLKSFPNPFHSGTTVSYNVPKSSHAILEVYDILGNQVITLVNQRQSPGRQLIEWNGHDHSDTMAAPGIYICHLRVGEYVTSHRILCIPH